MTNRTQQDDDDEYVIINGRKVARDGTVVRVPFQMMDNHSPELQRAIDAAKQLHRNENFSAQMKGYAMPDSTNDTGQPHPRYAARDKRLSEAWKHPPPVIMPGQQEDNKPLSTLTADERQAAKDKRLENQWKEGR